MHDIEPFYSWQKYYSAKDDPKSPFYGVEYNFQEYTNDIYGYYIHPTWDYIGSETLYIKVLFVDYKKKYAVIECFGEWNDAINNDIMHLKRNVLDEMTGSKINQYILIGENVFNFHGSDDSYYEEWFEDVEDGWIAAINFRDFVCSEWQKYGLDSYINFGGTLEFETWRTMSPTLLYEKVSGLIMRRLGM